MCDENNFRDYVKSLSVKELLSLEKEIRHRKFELKLGGDSFYKVALEYDRKPICPKCKSDKYIKFGLNKKGEQRYQCKECKAIYNLMSSSIFNSIKKDLPTFYNFIVLLTYNIPLDMAQEILNISRPSALLWRHKIFETVKDYQEKTKLSGRVWIDEIYIDDPALVLTNGVIGDYQEIKFVLRLASTDSRMLLPKLLVTENQQRKEYSTRLKT